MRVYFVQNSFTIRPWRIQDLHSQTGEALVGQFSSKNCIEMKKILQMEGEGTRAFPALPPTKSANVRLFKVLCHPIQREDGQVLDKE